MLTCCHLEQDVVVAADSLLCLDMGGQELTLDILHVTDTGKGHLLFNVMTEPVATDGIAKDGRSNGTEKQAPIEHGLQGETTAEGERHPPVGSHLAHTCLVVELCEVISKIGVFSIEPRTSRGEVPIVLAVDIQSGTIAEEVLVFECHLYGVI